MCLCRCESPLSRRCCATSAKCVRVSLSTQKTLYERGKSAAGYIHETHEMNDDRRSFSSLPPSLPHGSFSMHRICFTWSFWPLHMCSDVYVLRACIFACAIMYLHCLTSLHFSYVIRTSAPCFFSFFFLLLLLSFGQRVEPTIIF